MTLLASSPALKLAIWSLDSVLATFPNLVAARWARATSYHRLWLNSAPVQVQRYRAASHTYAARFVSAGVEDDVLALHRARRDYLTIVEREEIPEVLSNLALAEAYTGRLGRAQARARRFVAGGSNDVTGQNNRGVVLALSGQLRAALDAFECAAQLAERADDLAVEFNRAKASALLGSTQGLELLERYLELDGVSGWSNEIRCLLGWEPRRTPVARMANPEVRPGIALGSGLAHTMARLGPAGIRVTRNDALVLRYPEQGLRLVFGKQRGAILIELLTAQAGSVHGVRVGDAVELAGERWGRASERGVDHAVYWMGRWGIGVDYNPANGEIEMLSLAAG